MTDKPSKPTNLGRGLAAFFGEDCQDYAALDRVRASRLVPIEALHANPLQPRRVFDQEAIQSLADSIGLKGILQPILVRRHPHKRADFEIVAGERRWKAAQLAGLDEVPVVIRELTDGDVLELALVENLQRQDLSPLEEAEGYSRLLKEFNRTQNDLAQVVGKSRSHVANTLRLLNLPAGVRDMIEQGQLTAGHARALLGLDEAEALARRIVEQGLSVRETERLINQARATPASRTNVNTAVQHPDIAVIERDLKTRLGLNVKVKFRGSGGSITINYSRVEQLDDILRRLN